MKNSIHAFTLIVGVALASHSNLSAQTEASSKPMGYVTYTAKGNSDTRIGAPVHRKAAFVGKVDSVASGNVISVQGAPGWTANEFTDPTNATPPASTLYFVLIASGDKEGRHYEVTANGANTLTIDLAGDTIAADVVNGTPIKLIPYWTLNTLFPDGEGLHPSSNFGILRSAVIVPSVTQVGVNPSSSDTYFYYDGSIPSLPNPQWARLSSGSANYQHQPLAPDLQMILRHNEPGDTEISPIGDVYTTTYRSIVNVLDPSMDQDNVVFLTVPIDVSLADSNLVGSGVVIGNPTFNAALGDSVRVYDGTAVEQNKSSSATYFYHDGSLTTAGWYESGKGPVLKDADIVFSLDKQAIIRKKSTGAPSTVWQMTPSYLPFQ